MARSIKDNVSETATWIRLVYLVVYAAIFSLVGSLVVLVSVSQFLLKLFTGRTNSRLKLLGRDLGIYVSDIASFVTFHGTTTPYPFSAWPSASEQPVTTKKTSTTPKKKRSTARKSTTRRRKTATRTAAPARSSQTEEPPTT